MEMPNPQYEYDHRQDQALFMDSDYVQRKLRSMQNAYEKYKDLAAVHGGPACIETFGEEPFAPVSTEGGGFKRGTAENAGRAG